jgi:hypothetical protein
MVNYQDKLEIFERFEIDKSLPKYQEGIEAKLTPTPIGNSVNNDFVPFNPDVTNWGTVVINNGTAWSTGAAVTGGIGSNVVYLQQPPAVTEVKPTWISTLLTKWKNRKEETKKVVEAAKVEKKKTATIVEFFSSLALSLNDLKTMMDIAVHYETMISNAQKAGQTALVETLKQRLVPAKTEAQLVTYGLKMYLSEEQVVEFYKKTDKDKHLKLTWVKNFIKPIPTKILDLKEKLDKTFVFDNYVILHYDPNNDATNLTKAEIEERKKDPIIFGLIAGSRRLYYVGDWIDEYCSLTLDVVLETLGDKASEINNETVKTFIERGYEKEQRLKREVKVDPEKVIVKPPIMIAENKSKEDKKKTRKR